ncbi:AmmeMemoRadiSam system protein B [bacterium]|nr:AmmeMemoRadiSam system protein B [bacterium]
MSEEFRPSILAGTWYPKDPEKLRNMINGFFDKTDPSPVKGHVLGLISPHAGYMYSGQTAAHGYKALLNRDYDVVVIFCPMHHYGQGDFVVNGDIAYETPLGQVPVNRSILNELKSAVPIEEMYFDQEHAIEIQLPFLQVVLKDFTILPIMVAKSDFEGLEPMISGLVRVLFDKRVLMIASTDMHHINDYQSVQKQDRKVADALATYDMPTIRHTLSCPGCSVCGRVPLIIVLETLKRFGAKTIKILHQTHSADVIGNYGSGQYTVGYLSAAVL